MARIFRRQQLLLEIEKMIELLFFKLVQFLSPKSIFLAFSILLDFQKKILTHVTYVILSEFFPRVSTKHVSLKGGKRYPESRAGEEGPIQV